jgi:hypothetical protein
MIVNYWENFERESDIETGEKLLELIVYASKREGKIYSFLEYNDRVKYVNIFLRKLETTEYHMFEHLDNKNYIYYNECHDNFFYDNSNGQLSSFIQVHEAEIPNLPLGLNIIYKTGNTFYTDRLVKFKNNKNIDWSDIINQNIKRKPLPLFIYHKINNFDIKNLDICRSSFKLYPESFSIISQNFYINGVIDSMYTMDS